MNQDELYWSEQENQRLFILKLAKKLNLNKSEWHKLTHEIVEKHGGKILLSLHSGFVVKIICENWPETEWEFWKYEDIPLSFWKNEQLRK